MKYADTIDYKFWNEYLPSKLPNTDEFDIGDLCDVFSNSLTFDKDDIARPSGKLSKYRKLFDNDARISVPIKGNEKIFDQFIKDLVDLYNESQIGLNKNSEYSDLIKNKDNVLVTHLYKNDLDNIEVDKNKLMNKNTLKHRILRGVSLGALTAGLGTTALSLGENSELGTSIGLGTTALGLGGLIGSQLKLNSINKENNEKYKYTTYKIDPDKYYAFASEPFAQRWDEETDSPVFTDIISPDTLIGGPYNSREEARIARPKAKTIHKGSVVLRYPGFIQE